MDEAWERAVEAALEGQATPPSELRVLNLDGAVKSLLGCLPPPGLLERFTRLEYLSITNVGVLSLERFPRLPNLQRLILSDNRIAGGLESLVIAGLHSLRDLDLSNNRIQHIEHLVPLSALHLVSLDLYECPVTRVHDYRSKVFSMIRTLKYLDKLDANENERPETDDEEEEDEEEDEYDDDEEDPGSGEVDGGEQTGKLASGVGEDDGVVEDEDDDDLGEEIDEEEDQDDDEVKIHDVLDSDEEDEDGVDEVEDDEEDIDEEDEDDDETRVGDEENAEHGSTGRLASTEGEIDEHEHGEEDENGEIGEENEQGLEDRDDDDDENYAESEDEDDVDGGEYLVQPIGGSRQHNSGGGGVGNEEEVDEEDENQASSSPSDSNKRRKTRVEEEELLKLPKRR